MKNTKIISLILTSTLLTGMTITILTASTSTMKKSELGKKISNSSLSKEKLNELNEWINNLKKDFGNEKIINHHQSNEPVRLIVLKAGEWLMRNWGKVIIKAQSWVNPYLGETFSFKVLDKYMQISDTIDELVWSVLRNLLPSWIPNPIVDELKNVIVSINTDINYEKIFMVQYK